MHLLPWSQGNLCKVLNPYLSIFCVLGSIRIDSVSQTIVAIINIWALMIIFFSGIGYRLTKKKMRRKLLGFKDMAILPWFQFLSLVSLYNSVSSR